METYRPMGAGKVATIERMYMCQRESKGVWTVAEDK